MDPLATADGSFTLHSERYGQTYHSIHGAITESNHVYLEGGGVLAALQQRQQERQQHQGDPNPAPLRILEVGLGLGVNALLSAEAARRFGVPIDYVGIEHDFVSLEVIRGVLAPFPEALVSAFCDAVKAAQVDNEMADAALITSMRLNPQFQLSIVSADLNHALENLLHKDTQGFDALYLDAFSPDSNPECWTPDILAKLAQTLAPNGRLTTYCAKGSVRRALQAAGLNVTRRPGPPGKRECLVACS